MLDADLAHQLLAAGLLWTPAPGDRFVVPGRDLDGEVFHIAEMTIEVHEFATGRVLGFNGTTEWALDSLDLTDVLWLPREDQLREALGERFVRLERTDGCWVVAAHGPEGLRTHRAPDVEDAYAVAVLAMLGEVAPGPSADTAGQ